MESQKRMRVNTRHWDLLLNLLEENPEMVTGKFVCQNAKQKMSELWHNAAIKLNALGFGEKSPDKWKVALQDWKYKTKMKVAEIKQHEKKTGGGPQIKIKLSEQEERLMNIIGWTAALGNESVPESGLTPIQQLNITVDEATSEVGTSSSNIIQLSDITYSEGFMDTQEDIFIMNVDADKPISTTSSSKQSLLVSTNRPLTEVSQPSTSNKRPKPERSTNRTSSKSDDPLHTYQKETMAVLKEISDGIKSISSDLKSISQSLSIIANKLL